MLRRHRVAESMRYNWRVAWKAAASIAGSPGSAEFVPLGIFHHPDKAGLAILPSLDATLMLLLLDSPTRNQSGARGVSSVLWDL